MNKKQVFTIGVFLVIGMVLGAAMSALLLSSRNNLSQEERIAEFYATETSVLVSPHGIRKNILDGKNDAILVDVRSQEEYEREHIVGALSVPAYKDPETSAYSDVERIVNGFQEIREQNPEKDIVVYCYSIPCMTGRKVGHMLAENGIYAKELNVGWNEWRYEWTSWNHEHEWEDTNAEQYISSGPEPGEFVAPEGYIPMPCSIDNELGC